jgi:hypothetical protein
MQEGDRRGESEVRLDECGRGERGREKKSATLEKARATFHVLIFELLRPVPCPRHPPRSPRVKNASRLY